MQKKKKGGRWHLRSLLQMARAEARDVRGTVQRFRGGLVFKAHRLLYHSTLGLRAIKKKKKRKRRHLRSLLQIASAEARDVRGSSA